MSVDILAIAAHRDHRGQGVAEAAQEAALLAGERHAVPASGALAVRELWSASGRALHSPRHAASTSSTRLGAPADEDLAAVGGDQDVVLDGSPAIRERPPRQRDRRRLRIRHPGDREVRVLRSAREPAVLQHPLDPARHLVDVPTGEADRDERLGWCAKGPLVPTWLYTLDMGAFLSKWMVDLVDSQSLSANESGAAFMQVAPFWGDVESPGWSDDGISVPYGLYKAYGDTGIIRKHYDAMARYIGCIQSKLVNHLRPANLRIASHTNFVGYGDWLAITQNREGNADIFNTLLARRPAAAPR